ncbi:MAG TPA: hydantoinase/oxoprolinase family protein, partial [Rhodothermales bacterium]|nr:hydantoinase/oxoprolinase family protein [Rhodothermales bacterium]
IPHTAESTIANLPLRLPSTEIHTVGAGGGSIARVDAGGVLRVGPESAGADPGPACYGHGGTEPTVTDANLVLGRLDEGSLLDESQALSMDEAAAQEVLAQLGNTLNLSPEAAALGVVRVANAAMERALRRVSVERGHDPRDYVLVPFGGAGPLHACDLANALGVRRILVPRYPGVLSALGLLMADVVHDTSQAVLQSFDTMLAAPDMLRATTEALSEQAQEILAPNHPGNPQVTASLDLRYAGQSYELSVPIELPVSMEHLEHTRTAFHDAHAQRYGYATPERAVEAVTVRVQGRVPGAQLHLPEEPITATKSDQARLGEKLVWFSADTPAKTPYYHRDKLRHGHRLDGPALVFQYDTTLVITPGWQGRVDAWHNLWLER